MPEQPVDLLLATLRGRYRSSVLACKTHSDLSIKFISGPARADAYLNAINDLKRLFHIQEDVDELSLAEV